MQYLQSVILSGGSGTRLWPLSRQTYPKQFLPLVDEQTLLQQTINRLNNLNQQGYHIDDPLVVCNEAHRFLVAEQLRLANHLHNTILLEPIGKNTAPALTLAALEAKPETILVVMPADHSINNICLFQENIIKATELASQKKLVTFGIPPNSPQTGYGYIAKGQALDKHQDCYQIRQFVEKPDVQTAQQYLESGNYLWNSGIFILQASTWLEAIATLAPQMAEICQLAWENGSRDGNFYRVDAEIFKTCPSDSIDYAVMEHLTDTAETLNLQGIVIPLHNVGWSDVGAWSSLWEVHPQDEQGNVCIGDTYLNNTHNTLAIAQHRFVAIAGVDDLVVVETADAVLVTHKDDVQEVKAITQYLKTQGRTEHEFHQKVHRPWGSYQGIDEGERFQVKRLTVNPGASLSLQRHHHRAEHWIVVKGTAKVIRGEECFLLTENQSTYIPLGTKHRLENPGSIPLEIIEVQSGSYLGEDDIVRFEDKYNRIGDNC